MATMTETPQAAGPVTPTHEYHAKANVFSGELKRPIVQKIEPQAPVSLEDRRGGFFNRSVEDVSIEGLISFTRGQTRLSGARSLKHQGWVTLATSVIEGFNIFETITSDRVVAQVSTDHPYENGHVPLVTFLGTQFDNLRVSGFPIPLALNLGICGPRPEGGRSYLHDSAFLTRVRKQTKDIADANGLPKEIKARYIERLERIEELIRLQGKDEMTCRTEIICSLVQDIDVSEVDSGLGVQAFGHVLVVPEFGVVEVGEIEVGEKNYEGIEKPCAYFRVTGLRIQQGCSGDGTHQVVTVNANGRHYP